MSNKQGNNSATLFVIGTVVLITGVTMIFVWWSDVVHLFRGGIGMLLALAGLFILYNIKK